MEAGDFLGLVHLQRKTSSQETREKAIEEDIQHGPERIHLHIYSHKKKDSVGLAR